MSDTARPKSGGDQLSADEINQDLPVVVNAGETINGATLPVPVFVLNADGELYACDANDSSKFGFIGFVVNNTTDGNPATLQKNGLVDGFSGLTIGAKYYVQDTAGTIGVNVGTMPILVGIAISATQLLIQKGDRYTTLLATRAGSASSGNVNYAHGLGTTPKRIKAYAFASETAISAPNPISIGTWDGNGVKAISIEDNGSSTGISRSSTSNLIYIDNSSNQTQAATVNSVDATNLTLTWTKGASAYPGNANILFEFWSD